MAMKLLPFHDQFVADFTPHDEYNDVFSLHIVQGTEVSYTQFELGKRIGA
jgi:hypothetical protein